MGKYWLHNFPLEAAARGLQINLYPGWELRSRGSGGFDEIRGVCLHHTASSSTATNDMSYMWNNAATRPIGNFYLARDGSITLGTAGASNTQGAGGPVASSRGTVPIDASNRYHVAIEAANSGTGEIWPQAQLDAYLKLVWALCDVYRFDPSLDVIFHNTWAPARKSDPAGPTPSYPDWGGTAPGARTWNLANFRQDVLEYNQTPVPDMSNFQITNPVRILETRVTEPVNGHNPWKGPFQPGQVIGVRPHGYTPADVDGVILSLTGIGYNPGHWTVWGGPGDQIPTGSNLNAIVNQPVNNMVWVPLTGGHFYVYSHARSDLLVDQVGWYWQ